MGTFEGGTIRVLHVDDEPEFAGLTATYLEREDDRFTVETAHSAAEGIERLDDDTDCVVSDYDMPGQSGIEFLEAVRGDHPDLPFILFTGKGSEAVASDAISAGVTDYLQKKPGTEQYELLAHRIGNAVEQSRATHRVANLDRVRRILGDVNQALVRADSRDEIDRRVCEIVSEAEPYRLAWVGGVEDGCIEVRASAGQGADYPEEITVTADTSATGRGPVGTAARERRVAVTQNLREDPAFEPWREAATARGYRAAAAVPLEYGGDCYGLLAVYADRAGAFDGQERELLGELGADVAHAHRRVELRARLEQREAHLEQAQAVADAGSWHRDFESGDLYWSEEVYRIFGVPEGARPSHDVFIEAVHPEDRGFVEERWAAAQSGEPYDIEHRIVVDGETRWVRERAQIEFDGEGDPVEGIGVAQDITEYKQHERELRRRAERLEGEIERREAAETRYRSLFENNPIVIWEEDFSAAKEYVDDLAGETEDLAAYFEANPGELDQVMERIEVIDVNENALDYYGAGSKAELIGNLDRVMTEESRETSRKLWASVAAGETRFRAETVSQSLDGKRRNELLELYVPEAYADDYSRVYLTGTDITERKRRERELERERDRLAAVFDAVPHPITEVELRDGEPVVRSVNDAFEEVFGYSEEEVAGRSLDEFIVPADRKAEAKRLNRLGVEGEQALERQVERATADGERRTFLFRAARVDESDDSRWLSTYFDITEREQRARELERQNERLDEFASIASHDLRSPLHTAAGRLELARDECASDHLDGASDALERMEGLIEDLLALARSERPVTDTEPVALGPLVESCWGTVETADATLSVEADATIRADRPRLRQLVENLVRNAVDHGGERVTIAVGDLDGGFYVADDGPGIPAEERERVFESGYSTVEGGTGIGLDIVSQIADAHGWEVAVTESDGGGARIEVTGVDGEF